MLTNSSSIGDWFYLVPSAILIDTIAIFFTKYPGENPSFKVISLDQWYDTFGIFAITSDVTSILIGIAISRYIYTLLGLKNILYFFAILFTFQIFHDLFFYLAVILPIKEGENEMIDVFKEYAKENGYKILLADAILVFSTFLLGSFLYTIPNHYTSILLLLTLYTLCYIMFTKPPSTKKNS